MTSPEGVPLLDVGRGNGVLHREILAAVEAVLMSGRFLHGPDVTALEEEIAARSEVGHAIACASGSDALLLALMALGVGPGDEVICPSFTFFATASCVHRLGGTIVFADIDPTSFNVDPAHVGRLITDRTKAVIPVHLFGQSADMGRLQALCRPRGIPIVEDVCQAIGARWDGRSVGSFGDVGCLSFYPTKTLGGAGDGGMMVTRLPLLERRLRLAAAHGMQPRYHHKMVGINSRLDTIQAAILRVKHRHLDAAIEARRANAERYHAMFADAGLEGLVAPPSEAPGAFHTWNQYTVRVLDGPGRLKTVTTGGEPSARDGLRAALADRKIGTEVYYPIPLHRQECFWGLGYGPGTLPETERAAGDVLSLPIYPEVTAAEQATVVAAIRETLTARRLKAA